MSDNEDLDEQERRKYERYPTSISVDYSSGDTFLFSYIENISEMGIFIRSDRPLPIGTRLQLRFATDPCRPFLMEGQVVWINPVRVDRENLNPGMGVRFTNLTDDQRERVVSLVRTIAYLRTHSEDSQSDA